MKIIEIYTQPLPTTPTFVIPTDNIAEDIVKAHAYRIKDQGYVHVYDNGTIVFIPKEQITMIRIPADGDESPTRRNYNK